MFQKNLAGLFFITPWHKKNELFSVIVFWVLSLIVSNKAYYFRDFSVLKSNRKAMNRNWSNQKANPAFKTKTGNK